VVRFTDASSGLITGWAWDFGDGGASADPSLNHTYLEAGEYAPTLTVVGPGGSNSKTASITVTSSTPAASFGADPAEGWAPLAVQFTDTSAGEVDAWTWSFGDGGGSEEQNPSHVFAKPGSYPVTLTVSGPGGSDSASSTVVAHKQGPPKAAFTAVPKSGPAPLAVQFTDASTGWITGWSWTFGDGGASSEPNPSHTYPSPGKYKATLTVTGPGGAKAKNAKIKVTG
jgi:PKD repeat protein